MIRSEVDPAASDAEIGRALRVFLAESVATGRLDAPFDIASASSEQLIALVGEILVAREKAERRGREARERLDLAMQNTEGGLWDWDLVSGALVMDDNWRQFLGYSESECSASFADWLPLVHHDDLEVTRHQLIVHLRGEFDHFETQFRVAHKAGGWRWVLVRGRASSRGEDGRDRLR